MVNLEWFRTFKAIYETGTLTAAAEKLFISQPGVSLHLNSLEVYVGSILFDRGSRKMVATEQGKMLYNSITDAVDKLVKVEKYLRQKYDKEKKTINIGMCFETFQFVLERYISQFPFNLVSKFGDYTEMLDDLDKGLLDFVITPHKKDMSNISFTPFAKERIVLVAGNKTNIKTIIELLEHGKLQELEVILHQQKWFGTTGDMEHLHKFWLHNFGKRSDLKLNYIVPNITSIIRCISNNEGLAIIPHFLCNEALRDGDVTLVWEGVSPLENTVYFAQRSKTIYMNEINTLKEIFKDNLF